MKTFQQTYTTIEQSKRLLELGLPKATADMYYSAIGIIDEYFDIPTVCAASTFSGYIDLPCWSVGRLIDILLALRETHTLELYNNPPVPTIESIVLIVENDVHAGRIDFSKLED